MPSETRRALIVVRTYPTPAQQGIEVSCTAAITPAGDWMRLFPVPYRFLDPDKRFRKYQWVKVRVSKASDHRQRRSVLLNLDACSTKPRYLREVGSLGRAGAAWPQGREPSWNVQAPPRTSSDYSFWPVFKLTHDHPA